MNIKQKRLIAKYKKLAEGRKPSRRSRRVRSKRIKAYDSDILNYLGDERDTKADMFNEYALRDRLAAMDIEDYDDLNQDWLWKHAFINPSDKHDVVLELAERDLETIIYDRTFKEVFETETEDEAYDIIYKGYEKELEDPESYMGNYGQSIEDMFSYLGYQLDFDKAAKDAVENQINILASITGKVRTASRKPSRRSKRTASRKSRKPSRRSASRKPSRKTIAKKIKASTYSEVGVITKEGTLKKINVKFDGDLEGVGKDLLEGYNTYDTVLNMVNLGNSRTIGKPYRNEPPIEFDNINEGLIPEEEYSYIFDNGKWYVASKWLDEEDLTNGIKYNRNSNFIELTKELINVDEEDTSGKESVWVKALRISNQIDQTGREIGYIIDALEESNYPEKDKASKEFLTIWRVISKEARKVSDIGNTYSKLEI